MKKYLYILLLIVLLGCQDALFEEVTKYVVIDTEREKIDLMNGIYSRLVAVHNSNYFNLMCRSDDVNVYINYSFWSGGDIFLFPEMDTIPAIVCGSAGRSFDVISYFVNDVYTNLYAAVINANELICVLSSVEDAKLLGEAYFLRAYCYFKLARLFGTPPLVIDTNVNYLLEKPSYAGVYDLITEDLLNAIDLLPKTYSLARVPFETPHEGTAKALLAEVYLAMAGYPVNDESKYAEAARLAGEVIDKAEYYGFELVSDIRKLRVSSKQYCKEHIFSLQTKGLSYSLGSYKIEFKYFKTYPDNYRKNIFIHLGQYEYLTHTTIDTTYQVLVFKKEDPLINPCTYLSNVYYQKWTNLNEFVDGVGADYVGENLPVKIFLLRYAQTLLTYAEAKARLGQLDESCYDAVNQIRRRANKLDLNNPSVFDLINGLSSGQFVDSVIQERSWELCGEPDGRWFDIIRLDLRYKMNEYRYPFDIPALVPAKMLTNDWYFYEIPEEDKWLNPNFE